MFIFLFLSIVKRYARAITIMTSRKGLYRIVLFRKKNSPLFRRPCCDLYIINVFDTFCTVLFNSCELNKWSTTFKEMCLISFPPYLFPDSSASVLMWLHSFFKKLCIHFLLSLIDYCWPHQWKYYTFKIILWIKKQN